MSEKHSQAMILTAYNDFEILALELNRYCKYYDCYVHIDKKSVIPQSFYTAIKDLKNVYIEQKYRINWGGYNHIKAVLRLLRIASQKGYTYYHILSANTLPIKPLDDVVEFFENTDKNYVETYSAANDSEAMRREQYIWFPDFIDAKKTSWKNRIYRVLHGFQNKLSVYRKPMFCNKGYFYCHITDAFVKNIFSVMKRKPSLALRFRTTFIPEEFFFQYFACSREFQETIVPSCLIYSDWTDGGSGPKELTEYELKDAEFAENLFCRKITNIDCARKLLFIK